MNTPRISAGPGFYAFIDGIAVGNHETPFVFETEELALDYARARATSIQTEVADYLRKHPARPSGWRRLLPV